MHPGTNLPVYKSLPASNFLPQKIQKMCKPILPTLVKMPENSTASSGTPPLAYYREVPPPQPMTDIQPGVVNRTKSNQKPIEPNRSIEVRLVQQSNIIELELFCEFD